MNRFVPPKSAPAPNATPKAPSAALPRAPRRSRVACAAFSRPAHAAAVAITLLAAPQTRAAAPPTPISPATHEESRTHFRAGNQAWIDGDKGKAREHYKLAFELEEAWDVACNLGRAEGELGLDAEALTHLDVCLKEYPPSTDRRVQEARVKFYDLRVEIRDRCKKMGCSYRDPAPSSGLGEEPRPVVKPTTTQETKAPEKKEVPKEFAPPPEGKPKAPSAKWPVVISTAAVGAVGVGLGGGFFVASEGKKDEAVGLGDDLVSDGIGCERYRHPRCDGYAEAKQSYFSLQTAGVVAVSVGGGLLLTSGVLALVWPERSRTVAREWHPVVSISEQGTYLGLAGRF